MKRDGAGICLAFVAVIAAFVLVAAFWGGVKAEGLDGGAAVGSGETRAAGARAAGLNARNARVSAARGAAANAPSPARVTLSELKASAPERLVIAATSPDGSALTMDIAVILPEAERMTAREVAAWLPSEDAVRALIAAGHLTDESASSQQSMLSMGVVSLAFSPYSRSRITTPYNTARDRTLGGAPDGNSLPAERPLEKLRELLAALGSDARVTALRQASVGAAYPAIEGAWQRTADGGFFAPVTVYREKPRKGYEVGYYDLLIAQEIGGAPVFLPEYGGSSFQMLDEQTYTVSLSLYEAGEALSDDVALAPLSAVRDALARSAASGELLAAYEISLGWAARPVDGETDGRGVNARCRLAPVWRVVGVTRERMAERAAQGLSAPDEAECRVAPIVCYLDAETARWTSLEFSRR